MSRYEQIRHNRILDLRKKILKSWTMEELMAFCVNKLQVTKVTATSYIDEAAAPYRKKHEQQSNLRGKNSN